MPVLTIGRQPISYREQGAGEGPPLLLVHGAGGSSLCFVELLDLLGRHRRVVALDLPGHGRSPRLDPPPPPSELLERYRDVVAELGERLGLGRFVLVGHSMGGAVALLFGLAYADRLAHLVLLASAARLKVAPPLLEAIRDRFDGLADMLGAVGYSAASDPRQVQRWAADQLQAPQEVVLDDFRACALFDVRERLGALDCPTLVVSGADDRLTPPRWQQRAVELLPRARLETVSRAGHFLFCERPDEVARLVLQV
jgi:pimeloyl-ACP methyl ester carboxylesterase